MRSSAAAPMRVMMRMLATTYGVSVISTPQRDSGESIGPMQYGKGRQVKMNRQQSSAPFVSCNNDGACVGAGVKNKHSKRHLITLGHHASQLIS